MNRFEGLIAAPFAPMSATGEVMYDRIESYYDFLDKNRVHLHLEEAQHMH